MPLYEYECEACKHRLEIIQKFSDGPPETCPKCGKGPLHRQQSSPAIQFKGTGWYVTDYAGKGKGGSDKGEGEAKPAAGKSEGTSATASDTSSSSASETKKSETKKSETKKSESPAAAPAASKDS